MKPWVLALLALAVVVAAACSPEGVGGTSGTPALRVDFENYERWESFFVDGGTQGVDLDGGSSAVHTAGPRTIYLNKRPPKGSKSFPEGTFIVKQSEFATFAMHKRGGTYNAKGAAGWEWVELEKTGSGAVVIVWQGLGPPAGERYGDVADSCNTCHSAARDNDSVLAEPMKLPNLWAP